VNPVPAPELANDLDRHAMPEVLGVSFLDLPTILPHERDASDAMIEALNDLERLGQKLNLVAKFR
jgi:hypothetical protein